MFLDLADFDSLTEFGRQLAMFTHFENKTGLRSLRCRDESDGVSGGSLL